MSNIVKWALMGSLAIAIITIIFTLPFVEFINFQEFGSNINTIISVGGSYLTSARNLLNNFLTPFGRGLLSGILFYLFGKWAILISIKIVSWIGHFVLK